jgi:hypothetical protein
MKNRILTKPETRTPERWTFDFGSKRQNIGVRPQGRWRSEAVSGICSRSSDMSGEAMVDEAPNALSREVELIRALAEDLAIEILASYTDDDFADADLSSLGSAAVYLSEYDALGPSFQQLIIKLELVRRGA